MAPARRKKAAAKSRAAGRRASIKSEAINGEESTSGSASTEDPSEEPPIVRHKKFGDIRVQQEEGVMESVIDNGVASFPLPPEQPKHDQLFNEEQEIPLPTTVIVKSEDFKDTAISQTILNRVTVSTDTFMNVLRGMEKLSAGLVENIVAPKTEEEVLPLPLPLRCDKSDSSSPMSLEDQSSDAPSESLPSSVDKEAQSPAGIRRSTRIRHIGIMKQKEKVSTGSPDAEKPVKVKSRWRRSSELEMHKDDEFIAPPPPEPDEFAMERLEKERQDEKEGLATFLRLLENEYHTARNACRDAKRMTCDCVLSREEIENGTAGCGDDCLNRMLFLECGQLCALGDRCTNKRFQKKEYADCKVFKTEKKGFGLRAEKQIPGNTFLMEYIGEVVDQKEFGRRVNAYAKGSVKHFYFMALKGDTVIDATHKGSISRFINHSCDPNAETQKWTVNGELRIGFFSRRPIRVGEEITFDYRFQRYGKEAQKCYCESPACRGYIGENAESDDEDESEEEEEEDEVEEEDEEEKAQEDDKDKTDEDRTKVAAVAVPEEAVDLGGVEATVTALKDGDSDMDVEIDATEELKPVRKTTIPKARKPKAPTVKKERRVKTRTKKKTEQPVVEDLGLEEELQRLSITGVKNRAHTLMVSRLMVRAEDWATRGRLLHLIRSGDEPCKRLFLDYHGLRFLHAWMASTATATTGRQSHQLELLKTLQALPIPNKTMLMDSKVLSVVKDWSGDAPMCKVAGAILSPDTESDEGKPITLPRDPDDLPVDLKPSPVGSDSPDAPTPIAVVDHSAEVIDLAKVLLKAWSSLKEVFKIPKRERLEQMKEHEREADRGYRHYLGAKENLDKLFRRYNVDRESRERHHDRDRDRDRNRIRERDRESPPAEPDWMNSHRKMTKLERRQLFALRVLREEEAARQRMQQEELWNQHKARCEKLGLDPNVNPAMDPISGCPIFFDQSSRTWSPNPPFQYPPFSEYPSYSGHNGPGFTMAPTPPNGMVDSPYSMVTYVTGPPPPPFPTPSPSVHLTPVYMSNPNPSSRYPSAQNIIPITPDPTLCDPGYPTPSATPNEEPPMPDAPVLTQVPLNAPIKLPPKWKVCKDTRGFAYYYHIKDRISQWEPPSWSEEDARVEAERALALDESSSESSETDSEEEEDETAIEETEHEVVAMDLEDPKEGVADTTQPGEDSGGEETGGFREEAEAEAIQIRSPDEQPSQSDASRGISIEEKDEELSSWEEEEKPPPLPKSPPPKTKRRERLVQERIISPRRESSHQDMKKYKEVKQMIKKRREERRAVKAKLKAKKKRREKRVTSAAAESSTDKKKKEAFKSNIAGAIVSHLNHYRKTDCKNGRITNNEDFKHLARKLTHFVMVKELKHCQSVDDLQCNDSVKVKARDFVKKYMLKFGAEYDRHSND